MENTNNRRFINWVASAKGIGVILVVVGHFLSSSNLDNLNRYIYSFHIPLFFALSGYVFKANSLPDDYLKNKFFRIIVPYFAYTLIGIPFFLFNKLDKGKSVLSLLLSIFYINGSCIVDTLWFLAILFEIFFVVFFYKKIFKMDTPVYLDGIFALFLFVFGGFLFYFKDLIFLNIFGFNRLIVCLAFFVFGIFLRKIIDFYESIINSIFLKCLLCFVSFVGSLVFGLFNTKISVYVFELGNYSMFIIGGIFGTVFVMMICYLLLDRSTYLSKIANYSILYLGLQMFMIAPIKKILSSLGYAKTMIYNIVIMFCTIVFIIFTPMIYEFLKRKIKFVAVLNGEITRREISCTKK